MTRPISHPCSGTQRPSPKFESQLRRALSGEVRFDRFTRGLYSTDASIYQIDPLGVVFPRSTSDVQRAVEVAGEHGVSIVPRGAGTSQSGQSIGPGLIADTSRHLDGVLELDPGARRVVVQPGLVLDRLNAILRPHGLFFPIDVATSSRATLGGMAGNNSAGARSVRYGHMVEHVRGVEAVLADGSLVSFGADRKGHGRPPPHSLVAEMMALYAREAEELKRRIPRVPRHVAGYALHRLAPPGGGDRLEDLLIGSEGTLAFFTALELDLQPIPRIRTLAVCKFSSMEDALHAVPGIVDLEPTAVELVDRSLLELATRLPAFRRTVADLSGGRASATTPGDWLIVEFAGDQIEDVRRAMSRLEQTLERRAVQVVRAEAVELQGRIWGLRKAGLNISMSMRHSRKPLAFIEDCAIPLDRLPEWHRRLTEIIERHATHAVWYAHASVGCLHVRPALDLGVDADVWRLRAIAEETFALAGELEGSHSGEHGDGIIRSEFIEPVLGSRLARAFEDVKQGFDPQNRFNPGKIVYPPRMDDRSLLRARRHMRDRSLPTVLDWSAWGGLAGAVDMCNNNGACRKRDPGVMCPSFRATADERHSTRGRAKALSLTLSGQLGTDAWESPDLYEAMDLCIGCKGCRRECPTGVDMARMKIEFQYRYRAHHGLTPRDRILAYLPRLAPWAARIPRLLNTRNSVPAFARLGDRWLGLAADRTLPHWAARPFAWPAGVRADAERSGKALGRGDVALLVDTFTRYFEPENAYAAIRVLRAAGYRVHAPAAPGRPLCCGRTFLNIGLVSEARAELERTVNALSDFVDAGIPVVGLEPSCLLTLRDELPALCPGSRSDAIASGTLLLSELLVRDGAVEDLELGSLPISAVRVHGHCHEKAFGLDGATLQVLTGIPDLAVHPIEGGCCGMAGSFGYESEHADISRRIAELELLPAVRQLGADEWLVANGTSCRHQVADLAGREGRHVATVLDAALL